MEGKETKKKEEGGKKKKRRKKKTKEKRERGEREVKEWAEEMDKNGKGS